MMGTMPERSPSLQEVLAAAWRATTPEEVFVVDLSEFFSFTFRGRELLVRVLGDQELVMGELSPCCGYPFYPSYVPLRRGEKRIRTCHACLQIVEDIPRAFTAPFNSRQEHLFKGWLADLAPDTLDHVLLQEDFHGLAQAFLRQGWEALLPPRDATVQAMSDAPLWRTRCSLVRDWNRSLLPTNLHDRAWIYESRLLNRIDMYDREIHWLAPNPRRKWRPARFRMQNGLFIAFQRTNLSSHAVTHQDWGLHYLPAVYPTASTVRR